MNLLSLIFIVAFIFCLAVVVASILIAHKSINTYNTAFHKNYFYYLVTFFAFALYGIWGQIIMRVLLNSLEIRGEVVETVANFLPVLGFPFLVISWIMLIKVAFSIVDKPSARQIPLTHMVILILFAISIWGIFSYQDENNLFLGLQLMYAEIGLLAVIDFIYMFMFAGVVYYFLRSQNGPFREIIIRFISLMLAGFVLRVLSLSLIEVSQWVMPLLILVYFVSNFLPILYLSTKSDMIFVPVHVDNPNEERIEQIYNKYKITKREKEIIAQICLGKTNQQIADELFISLQTVKDHTHRIYSKIGVNSRMKLVQLVNG
ncbi:MAG: helix-turn-helix transcriptional regulator [Bacteroidota bacterium]